MVVEEVGAKQNDKRAWWVICMGMENILRFDNRSEQSSASVRQRRGGRPEERIK